MIVLSVLRFFVVRPSANAVFFIFFGGYGAYYVHLGKKMRARAMKGEQ